ncbi:MULTISPECIES: CoA transferase [Sphingobium]|uniref:CoA transferase n=1 Tax=Sphingobium TaxID=165695 RepID=UPI00345F3DFC
MCDHRGLLAGHMLAQMGADVVQVESEGGNPARRLAPFAPTGPKARSPCSGPPMRRASTPSSPIPVGTRRCGIVCCNRRIY